MAARTIKPLTGFAVGLWIGAMVAAGVLVSYRHGAGLSWMGASSGTQIELEQARAELRTLKQEIARLKAELRRREQAAAELDQSSRNRPRAETSSVTPPAMSGNRSVAGAQPTENVAPVTTRPPTPQAPVVPPPIRPTEAMARQPAAVALLAEGGGVVGRVVFDGVAPPRRAIKTSADPTCAQLHEQEALLSEELIVGADGGVRDVFVYVARGLEGVAFEPPRSPALLNQRLCRYVPHVFGMQVGQPLEIVNSDDTLHNIHVLPEPGSGNQEFNLGQPSRNLRATRTFRAPEVMVRFKCDVHPWMTAYVGVLEHPYFDVTRDSGRFALAGLPVGSYEIAAWHETLGVQRQTVEIKRGGMTELEFVFDRPPPGR